MFTGLIQYTGRLIVNRAAGITIEVPAELRRRLNEGDSIAVNGVCLTAVRLGATTFDADLLPSTLKDTTLGELEEGSVVNLELALRAGDPMGGHIVQGHVDGTTVLLKISQEKMDGSLIYTFALPTWLSAWIVPKGSICVDGVSLTVQGLNPESFTVELIPETLLRTNLTPVDIGHRVNLEADLIVKTVSELLKRSGATE